MTHADARVTGFVIAALLAGRTTHADDTSDDERSTAAHAVTNPLPFAEQLKFIPSYTFSHDATRYRAELRFEPVLPYRGLWIPGLDVGDVWSIARFQLTAESLQNDSGTASGLENLNLVDLAARRFGEVTLGVGFGTVFPMATSPELGPAKWQLGPAVGFHDDVARILALGALVQVLWSAAGSSDVSRQSYATVQPFLALHVYAGLAITSDAPMSLYWAGGATSVPINLGLGYAFSKHFVGTAKGTVTVAGNGEGEVKAELDLSFLP